MITQYDFVLNRQKLLPQTPFANAHEEQVSDEEDNRKYFTSEDDDTLDLPRLCQIFIQKDEKNYIYYLVRKKGNCQIMEINPRQSQLKYHRIIIEFQATNCTAFSCTPDGRTFYCIDQHKNINKFERVANSRQLKHTSASYIPEVSRCDYKPAVFNEYLLDFKYFVTNKNIFYCYEKEPLPDGILDAEDLLHQEQKRQAAKQQEVQVLWYQGPTAFRDSNQFALMLKKHDIYCYVKVYAHPDSTSKTLLCDDHEKNTDISSFLEDEYHDRNILVRCRHRFLVFNDIGNFVSQVAFSDQDDHSNEVDYKMMEYTANFEDVNKNLHQQLKKEMTELLFEQGIYTEDNDEEARARN